jgi:hypothetical protein
VKITTRKRHKLECLPEIEQEKKTRSSPRKDPVREDEHGKSAEDSNVPQG